jgi:hypothetical protein
MEISLAEMKIGRLHSQKRSVKLKHMQISLAQIKIALPEKISVMFKTPA